MLVSILQSRIRSALCRWRGAIVSLLGPLLLCRHVCLRSDRSSLMALQRNGLPPDEASSHTPTLSAETLSSSSSSPWHMGLRIVLPPSFASCTLLIPPAHNKRSRAGRYDHG